MSLLNWCLLALEYSLKSSNETATQALINCVCTYADNKFVRALLYLNERIGGGKILSLFNFEILFLDFSMSISNKYNKTSILKT